MTSLPAPADPPPLQLLVGPPGHGVVDYAADVARALARRDPRTVSVAVGRPEDARDTARRADRVHLHVTERILGGPPEPAADALEALAAETRLTVTLHDVPQESDGTPLPRRIAAYGRFLAAAEAVVVNSAHEQALIAEHIPGAPPVHVIPLGARVSKPTIPAAPAHPRGDLVVLIAGYVYPGKGHGPAIAAAETAARRIRSDGGDLGEVIVRAIGRPSAGHEQDVDALTADAARRGVRFEVTGFLDDAAFARALRGPGIPLAAHEHVSASRSMLDWVEAGRRPLVVTSRYAAEMADLRPRTLRLYEPEALADRLADAWRHPEETWLARGTTLTPTLDDVAEEYAAWWAARA